jgi:hypothetical protein
MNEMSFSDYVIDILRIKEHIISPEEEPSFTYFNGEEKNG